MKTQRVDTWAAAIDDKPGALASKLKMLAAAGVNLEFVVARRSETPGKSVVFITPIKGGKQIAAAGEAGFRKSSSLHTVRIEGADKSGQGARVLQTLAEKGLNLRGISAAAIGKKFICHIALDTDADVSKAVRALQKL